MEFVIDLLQSQDSRDATILVIINLSTTFDNICHGSLLYCLQRLRMGTIVLWWLPSFLYESFQLALVTG